MSTHVMIDVETLGVGCQPVLLSLGAVKFDPVTGVEPFAHTFFAKISVASCLAAGLDLEDQVLDWWLAPDQAAARAFAFGGPVLPLAAALGQFLDWATLPGIENAGPVATVIWSHGLGFDYAALRRSVELVGHRWPFHYQAGRDTRTLFDLVPLDELDDKFFKASLVGDPGAGERPEDVPHHPVYDAKLQAWRVRQAYAWLTWKTGQPPRLPIT